MGSVPGTYQGDPAAAAAVSPAEVEAQQEDGHDEAEHGDKHHPALQHGVWHPRGCHQDPHQAPDDLQVKVGGQGECGIKWLGRSRASGTTQGKSPGVLPSLHLELGIWLGASATDPDPKEFLTVAVPLVPLPLTPSLHPCALDQALLRAGLMNREDDSGQVCLFHTQRVRSLPGAGWNPAHPHKQHRQLPSQRPHAKNSERREQAEERFHSG